MLSPGITRPEGITTDTAALRELPFNGFVGELLWLARVTRPDIQRDVSVLGEAVQRPGALEWLMVDRLLRYLAGTMNLGILYRYGNEEPLSAFADANWAHEHERRSRSGYLYLWGGAPVVWSSRKQTHATPLHTAESEW